MSSRRSTASRNNEDDINELIFKLQALLPQLTQSRSSRVPASQILKETCKYIKRLHREMDELSERLSQLLESSDTASVDIESLRSLLLQL